MQEQDTNIAMENNSLTEPTFITMQENDDDELLESRDHQEEQWNLQL